MIRAYIAAALILGAGAGLWYVQHLRASNEALTAALAASEHELRVQAGVLEQAKVARAVAEAHAARLQASSERYDDLRETLLRGDDDAPIPDFLCVYLVRLLGEGSCRNGSGGAAGSQGTANRR